VNRANRVVKHLRPGTIFFALFFIVTIAAAVTASSGAPIGLLSVVPGLLAIPSGNLSGVVQVCAASPAWAGQTLTVEVWFTDAHQAQMANLAAVGARVQFWAGRRVQCQIRGDQVAALAELPGVTNITWPSGVVGPSSSDFGPVWQAGGVQPQQTRYYGYGGTVSEGVQLTNASAFQAQGIAGAGSQIAIIAEGFSGYGDAEIPTSNIISFRADGGMGGSALGTATAEVVADMAPQAEVTLIAVDTALSLRQAANYVATGDFHVAVCTVGIVEGPFDGSDLVSRAVSNATNAGVFWVQASGDLAQRHWEGAWVDGDADGFADIGTSGSGIALALNAGTFEAYLSWYQTAGATTGQDYDLALYQTGGVQDTLIAQSAVVQNGDDPPAEVLIAYVPTTGVYELRLVLVNADASKPDYFQLYTPDYDMPETVAMPEGSLPAPALSPDAFTVGATWGTTLMPAQIPSGGIDVLEDYSGRGPTIGGLLKPNMVAPDRVTTTLEGYQPFLSTAAAAAHLGGAVGLLYSEDPNRDVEDLERILLTLAIPLPDELQSPNNEYGHGRLSLRVGLDTEAPAITVLYPQNSTTISSRTPLIRAKITDTGNGVNPATIVLRIDGVAVTGFTFNPDTGILSYLVQQPLTLTSHQITMDCSDNSGNAARTAVVNFRVALPMVDAGVHMFSLPYTYSPGAFPTPGELFGIPSGMQLARWWPGDSQYHVYSDPYASFDPPDAVPPGAVVSSPPAGLGYFVSLPNAATLNIAGVPLADVDEYEIRLTYGTRAPRGWNMIGCPFTNTVDWGSVQFITNGLRQSLAQAVAAGVTDGVLFSFRSTAAGGYYEFPVDPFAAIMEPFHGYWLHVWQDTTMVIYPPSLAVLANEVPPLAVDRDSGWRLQLVVSAGGHLDPCNFVGVNPAAGEQYDPRWAVCEPPAVDGSLRASLVERDWGEHSGYYAQIIRPASGRQTWDLEVACQEPTTQVSLRWPQLNASVPAGTSLILQDLDSGEEVYMRTSAGYSFVTGPQGGVRHLRLVASTDAAASLSLTSVSAQAAPGGGVAFTYALTQPAQVSAEIRNISGVLIKQFGSKQSAGGQVELLVWNGHSDRGSKVPAGRYLVCIIARADNGQTVQGIRPFEIIP